MWCQDWKHSKVEFQWHVGKFQDSSKEEIYNEYHIVSTNFDANCLAKFLNWCVEDGTNVPNELQGGQEGHFCLIYKLVQLVGVCVLRLVMD